MDTKAQNRAGKRRYSTKNEGEKLIIAWDGEGIKLRGEGKPQSYVLFGCSAEPHTPLIVDTKYDDLDFERLANYICDVGERYPGAKHIGYYFGYDQNMIIKSLPWAIKQRIYETGWVRYMTDTAIFRVKVVFGKQLWITRERAGRKTVVRIDDVGPFFASSFVKAYQSMFPDHTTDPQWQIVVTGKMDRANTTWWSMPTIRQYWEVEIEALRRLAVFFRDLMFKAGFPLTEWYGPGALARRIRGMHSLARHEHGGKEDQIPAGVHHAAKHAMFGGHFEQYILGRINRPVFGLDIRSAYPYAFTKVPTLREGGFWQEVESPSVDPETFGVYHVRYEVPGSVSSNGYPRRGFSEPQPLPWRNDRGDVVYSPFVEGWYWRPEVEMLTDLYPDRTQIFSGWEWRPISDEKPWADVLLPMFAARRELKEAGDPCQMAFKLGPNSLYGKMAQRTGWDKVNNTPPRSHTLCIAGFITSYCRALIMRVIAQIPPGDTIAVETDGIYTTCDPTTLDLPNGIGPELGQWELEHYDEMLYVQNGLYLGRVGDRWPKIRTRGIRADQITPGAMADYLATLRPKSVWEPLRLSSGERFTGLGAAISQSMSRGGNDQSQKPDGKPKLIAPKAAMLHCRWKKDIRELVPGGRGKRGHAYYRCDACKRGLNVYEGEHTLIVNTETGLKFNPGRVDRTQLRDPMSRPFQLPWEKGYTEPEWIGRLETEQHLLSAEDRSDLGAFDNG